MNHNHSGKFESISYFRNCDSPSVLLKPLQGLKLGVWVAHGEGRFSLDSNVSQYKAAAKYSYGEYPGIRMDQKHASGSATRAIYRRSGKSHRAPIGDTAHKRKKCQQALYGAVAHSRRPRRAWMPCSVQAWRACVQTGCAWKPRSPPNANNWQPCNARPWTIC